MTEDKGSENFFEEIMSSEVITVRCNGCGSDQLMNVVYAKYVTDGLLSCCKCRERE